MIKGINITKKFDNIIALDNISLEIKPANVFGLIGTNGAGKSTFLRIIAGIIKQDSGTVTINEQNIFENINIKSKFFYISDEQFFFNNCTPKDIKSYYALLYKNFDETRYKKLMKAFNLDEKRKIKTFSKGMKKQISIICGICSMTDYLMCDETFDGLDPVVRQAVKTIFAEEIIKRGLTPILASHNLRELEDICDNVGLLHKGGIILSKDMDELKLGIYKIQIVIKDEETLNQLQKLDIVKREARSSLHIVVIRGNKEEIINYISTLNTPFFEILPLSLEEIFIVETEVMGYDIKSFII